ncbi:MAG: hypothetical protein JKY49_13055 [Cohaesibacteraceae bacterium]|nr:hypothetical protein [Cohaesibacteraceae bacterium]
MAPELALAGLEDLPKDYVVLDPMSGSGMVLGTAAKLGISAIGYDLDPLACLISKANGTAVREERAREACEKLLSLCNEKSAESVWLPWVDEETQQYMNFWFAPKQQNQLRILSYYLVAEPFLKNRNLTDVLKVAVSRLIVTKDPKASLARDTAHSRPHRTITDNDFDIFSALPKSLDHVLKALCPSEIQLEAKAYRGDARKIGRVSDASIDCIVTSPPYLNAIDYMRGHRLSLVWLGFSISQLRKIRSRSVGAEVADNGKLTSEIQRFFDELNPEIDEKKRRILQRYHRDLSGLTREAYRVLKPGRRATYVIGNSRVKGHEIKNSELLILAATKSGFRVVGQEIRDIPENRRYMPMMNSSDSSLSKRMRTEHVLIFEKPT